MAALRAGAELEQSVALIGVELIPSRLIELDSLCARIIDQLRRRRSGWVGVTASGLGQRLGTHSGPRAHGLVEEGVERVAFVGAGDRQMACREPFAKAERLPLREADFQPNAVELAPHRHRHASEILMDFVFELELPNHRGIVASRPALDANRGIDEAFCSER